MTSPNGARLSGHRLHAIGLLGGNLPHRALMPHLGVPVFERFTEKEYEEAVKGLKAATDKVLAIGETAEKEYKAANTLSGETRDKVDKVVTDLNSLRSTMDAFERKSQRGGAAGDGLEFKSIGQRVVESDEVKAVLAVGPKWKGSAAFEVKNITSASITGTSGTTGLVSADRAPGIIQLPQRPCVIRDLLMPGSTESSSIDYVRETVFTNNAATVAENPANPKPQSDIQFALFNAPVRTIAHWVLASKQILADAPQLQSYIDGRLRLGLSLAEDMQFLNGDGTGTNLLGLMPQATTYAKPAGVAVANPTNIDVLRLAMLQAALALYPPTGHCLHPTDWATIELTKDNQNRYLFSNPTGVAAPVLWGLPVAVSLAMPQGSFLTGAFRYAAQIFDREDANVIISTEDSDNIRKNMVTLLAEERTVVVVYRGAALVKGTFAAPAGSGS